ncbi:MAG: TOMM precursor leader peptide-binding protein [Pseudomonadota bacterium]
MLEKPRFKASFDLHIVNDRVLFLMDEHRSAILEGDVYTKLVPLMDGTRTVADLVAALGAEIPMQNVFFALNVLQRRNYVVEGAEHPSGPGSPYLEYAFKTTEQTPLPPGQHTLDATRIAVRTVGSVSADVMRGALAASRFSVVEEADCNLLVVVTDDYLNPELKNVNQSCLDAGLRWLLVKPVGMVSWLGPLFQPGESACWACLSQRLSANRQLESFIRERTDAADGPYTSVARLPSSVSFACNLAATEIVNLVLARDEHRLQRHLVTYDNGLRKFEQHELVKRPQCPTCGDPAVGRLNAEGNPVELASAPKLFVEEGGHRTLTPDETYERYKHHVSPILGAVSQLVPAIGADNPLTRSYVAGHNFSMGIDSLVYLQESLRGMSGGKGSTDIQARVSGLCEAIERYSGLYWGEEHTVKGSYNELQPTAIHPNVCMGYSDAQYAVRKEWNSAEARSRCNLIPDPFDEDLQTSWTPMWSLTHQRTRYLPTAFCYYGHPDFRASKWCVPDSNGSAAGNCLEEAIFQGAMELVERDCVALWWYNRLNQPAVDMDSFDLPYVSAVKAHYASVNRDLWVIDLTSDLDICTLACISARNDQTIEDIVLGFGAHFDPKIALLRAITEVNQFLPSVSLKNPDGTTRYLFGDQLARDWWQGQTLEGNPYLRPDPDLPVRTLADFSNPSRSDIKDDIEHLAKVLGDNDMEMLVADQTRPDIGLNVVKVVIPELCHFWRRLGKQRMYEVPVNMGRLREPRLEADVNPQSIFF